MIEEYNITYFKYKIENKLEKSFIKKNFKLDYLSDNIIYFSMDKQTLRKIKLLNLKNNKMIKKIFENSVKVDLYDMLSSQLSDELAKSINKEILKNIMNLK